MFYLNKFFKRLKTISILPLIYPQRCFICGHIIIGRNRFVHPSCEQLLVPVKPPTCLKCGKPVFDESQVLCMDCDRKGERLAFDGGASVWVYTKEMMDAIASYKYQGKQQLGKVFAKEAVAVYGSWIRSVNPDCITCVPLNRKKLKKRGYNQAEVLAHYIGRMMDIPVDCKVLLRTRFTEPQKSLNPTERMKNLMQAFAPGPHASRYKRILLVDDIYTTGSTMQVCSMILKKCGVEAVYILSLCIGSDY